MIVGLRKTLFLGAKEDLAIFFVQAQEKGFIEFITDKGEKSKRFPEKVENLLSSIKILRKFPLKDPYLGEEDLDLADQVANKILDLTHSIEQLREEKRFLEGEIARVAPFGEFSFDDIAFIEEKGKRKVQFYCVKTSKTHEVGSIDSLIYVGTEYDLDYFIGIHPKSTSYPGMIEMRLDQTAPQIGGHLSFVEETLRQLEAERKGFAGHIEFLKNALLSQLDIHSLEKAQKGVGFPIKDKIFSVEAWVPDNKWDQLPQLIGDRAIIAEETAAEKEERVPTYMENKGANQIGEDLVRIYDIPSSKDKDPSVWILWAFALFFSMIVADGGYGLLYLALAFFLKRKFPKIKGGGKRFLKLLFILSTSCIAWGILTTSFLGIEFNPQSSMGKLSILNHIAAKKAEFHKGRDDDVYREWLAEYPSLKTAKNGREMLSLAVEEKKGIKEYEMLNSFSDSILLEVSLLIGMVHISLSLLRYLRRSWANIGWVLFAAGGYFYFPITLKATSLIEFLGWIPKTVTEAMGIQLLYGGIGLAIILALFQHKWKGIGEVAKVISVFADILSYLRLYALALASTIMARTFNEMGVEIGLVVGSVVILAGHSVNILLGTMGGVIHGLRLNFVEWYHYSFEGEGRLFNPLRKLRIKQE